MAVLLFVFLAVAVFDFLEEAAFVFLDDVFFVGFGAGSGVNVSPGKARMMPSKGRRS